MVTTLLQLHPDYLGRLVIIIHGVMCDEGDKVLSRDDEESDVRGSFSS